MARSEGVQDVITGVRRCLNNHCRKGDDLMIVGGCIIDSDKLAESGFS